MLFWRSDALRNRLGEPLETSIAPQPRARRQVGADGAAFAVGAVASGARSVADLTVIYTGPKRHFRLGCARRRRKRGCVLEPGIGMHTFGRKGRRGGRRLNLRCWRGGERCIRSTMIGHAPDSAVQVVRDIDGAVGALRESGGTKRSPTWLFDASGKSVREDDEFAGGLAILHRLKHHVVSILRRRRAIPRAVERDECPFPVDGG